MATSRSGSPFQQNRSGAFVIAENNTIIAVNAKHQTNRSFNNSNRSSVNEDVATVNDETPVRKSLATSIDSSSQQQQTGDKFEPIICMDYQMVAERRSVRNND